MADPTTKSLLSSLDLSAEEMRSMGVFPESFIEDYLNLLDNLIKLADGIDTQIDELLEEITTELADGTIPVVNDGKLVRDASFTWDIDDDILNVIGTITATDIAATNIVAALLTATNIITSKIAFNLTAGLTPAEGEMCWNGDDGTLNIGMPGGNVILQVGQEVHAPKSKADGSDIANGEIVYVSGASGANPLMALAQADASGTSSGTIAMATEDVGQNQLGYFTAYGLVRGIDTSGYTAGDQVYLSPTVAGGHVNVKPAPPYFIVKIGVVIRAHATEGSIFINISKRTNNFAHIRDLTANSVPYASTHGFLIETNPGLTFDGTDLALGADNAKFLLGLGEDVSLYFDGTDANIKTDEVAPSDLKLTCGAAKTLELQTPVYDDYVTPLGANNWNGASNNPTLTKLFDDGAGSQGVYGFVFSDGDEALITIQIPHRYKEGTNIDPHIHFMCMTDVDPTDKFGIEFEYTWANIGEDYAANTTLSTIDIDTGVDTQYMHQYADITAAGVDGTGKTISSILICRIKRVAATGDNYAGGIVIIDFDIHYQVDTMGSRQEGAK